MTTTTYYDDNFLIKLQTYQWLFQIKWQLHSNIFRYEMWSLWTTKTSNSNLELKFQIGILNSNLEKLQAKQHVAKKLIAKDARAANTSATYAIISTNANYFHLLFYFNTANSAVLLQKRKSDNYERNKYIIAPSDLGNKKNYLPSGSDRRMAASRWPVCTGWLPGSRRPPQARRTSCLGKVPALRRAASHRKCPACCPAWTRCWSRSPRSWCWRRRPAEGSPPESHAQSCRSKAGEWKEKRGGGVNEEKKTEQNEIECNSWAMRD